LLILGGRERQLIVRNCAPGGGRLARRRLRWPLAFGSIVTAAGVEVAVAACSAGAPASALRESRAALDRAAVGVSELSTPRLN
jgi:hypothetical protein